MGLTCKHYIRHCRIVSPCCGISFDCHHCHNARFDITDPDYHQIDRFRIEEVVCDSCALRQAKARSCARCSTIFGRYTCLSCAIWEDNPAKKIYHCDKCGICRVGDRADYFHCDTCSACLVISQLNNHICLEGTMKNDCPVCLEPMFDSIDQCIMMPQCGHMIHSECWKAHQKHNRRGEDLCLYCRRPALLLPPKVEEQQGLPDNPAGLALGYRRRMSSDGSYSDYSFYSESLHSLASRNWDSDSDEGTINADSDDEPEEVDFDDDDIEAGDEDEPDDDDDAFSEESDGSGESAESFECDEFSRASASIAGEEAVASPHTADEWSDNSAYSYEGW